MKGQPTELFLVIPDDDDLGKNANFNELDHEFVTWSDTRTNTKDIHYISLDFVMLLTGWNKPYIVGQIKKYDKKIK